MKRLSDMSDEEILKELKNHPENHTYITHYQYMNRLSELHKQAGMPLWKKWKK